MSAAHREARKQLGRALETFERHTDPKGNGWDAALSLACAARTLLLESEEGLGLFRVRMTMWSGNAEGTTPQDLHMQAIPSAGDYINTSEGELIVNDVHWNFDPRIPADVVLMLITPEELAAQRFENGEDDPMCMGCSHTYGEHCSDDLECPVGTDPKTGEQVFSNTRRFTR